MKRIAERTTVLILTVAVAGLVACQSNPDPAPAPAKPDSEFTPAPEPVAPTRTTPAAVELGAIYFDFDSSAIRADARPVLRTNAESLRRANASVTIEGHCDERGDEEYNLALGERRATSVKRYLQNLGVSSGSMRTMSYGEAKPAVQGHDESAWRWNRRSEFRSR
jgi:peptidoglycan-associated lipoprotein